MSESFLSIMGLLRNMPVGNLLQAVYCPAKDQCVTCQQETFASSFLPVMGPTPTGNHPAASAARELP